MQAEGVAACGKHFPGHGDTSTDSHLELPLVEHPLERLRDVELVPFRAAIEAQVATIMTAHIFMPALDEQRPATLSKRMVTGLLRDVAPLRRRHLERRPRDEGDRARLPGALGGRHGGRGRMRRRADLQWRLADAGRGSRSAGVRGGRGTPQPHARRGRTRATAACEGTLSRPGVGLATGRRSSTCGRRSARTPTAPSPTKWRASCDGQAARP